MSEAFTSFRILLIEDDDGHATIIQRHLRKIPDRRIEFHRASSLKQGIDMARDVDPDVVLLDLGLPDAAPESTLDTFIEAVTDVPVVVVTSQDDIDRAVDAVKRGAQDQLVKTSLSPELLARSISYAIQRKRTQQQLTRYAIELERSNQEFQQFAHVAAHELKSPLWSVSLGCELLLDKHEGQFDADSTEIMQSMVKSVHQMTTLINDLLEYARVESQAKEFEPVDVNRTMDEILGLLESVQSEANARIEFESLPTIMADTTQLRLLLQNLVSNAIKYRGDDPPTVKIQCQELETDWKFSVSDNGIGIPRTAIRKVFGLFERAHDRSRYEGTGLGLAICKRIVDRHKGTIWVESSEGEGSTFYFTFPKSPPTKLKTTADPNDEP